MKFKRVVIFLAIVLVLVLLAYYWPYIKQNITGKSVDVSDAENVGGNVSDTGYPKESAFVKRVIDGDTIEIDNGDVRLLGVNTPEKGKFYYKEAKDYLVNAIENKSVELLRDGDDKDKYERKLRYVFLGDRLINVELVENGLATTFMLDGLNEKYRAKFESAEIYARNNEVALWKKSKDICSDCIKLEELNPKEEFFIIKNTCSILCDLRSWSVKDDANHFFYLSRLTVNQSMKYSSKDVWNDEHDRFFMRDNYGDLVIFYEY